MVEPLTELDRPTGEIEEYPFSAVAVRFDPDLDDHRCADLLTRLPSAEQAVAGRLAARRKRVEFVLSRVIMRRVLGSLLGVHPLAVAYAPGPSGKLSLAGPLAGRLHFNLSHCTGHILFAARRGGIGVDIEPVARYREPIARRFFHPEEVAWLSGVAPDAQGAAFTHLWTVKEACAKATGAGLPTALRRAPVLPGPNGSYLGLRWWQLAVSPATRAAVALRDELTTAAGSLRIIDLDGGPS